MKLTDVDRTRLDAAVHTAEAATSAELVLVVKDHSGSYADLTLAGGLVGALLGVCVALYADFEFEPLEVVPAVLAAAALGALATWKFAPRLASKARRQAQVDEAALAAFARCGVHRTSGRTGVLLYVSSAERLARVLPDQGVIEAVPASIRAEWRAELLQLVQRATVEALAKLVESFGVRAGRFLPHAADDVDELQSLPGEASAVELS